ncbi:MAG: YeeE/YedE thiosulfate transporter family protein [Candidatus Sulfobium sp.]
MKKNNFWSPYIAGIGLGITLLATFYVVGWGLAASSAFSLLAGVGTREISPEYAGTLKYFARYLNVASPLLNWVLFEIGGLFLGALAGSLLSGNFRLKFDKASGCTSGVALSGGAQLALSGWIFVIAMFISGFIMAAFFRRLWS